MANGYNPFMVNPVGAQRGPALQQLSQSLIGAYQLRRQRQLENQQKIKQDYTNSMFEALQNPDRTIEIAQKLKMRMGESGASPQQISSIDRFVESYKKNPNVARNQLRNTLAYMEPEKWRAYNTLSRPEQAKKQKTGAFLVRNPQGEIEIATGVFDPISGNLETATTIIGGGDLVSKLGETGYEETTRKVAQARETEVVKGEEKRAAGLIDRGLAAAESTAPIRRAIDLLDTVKTGGIRAAALRAKQLFGVEGADEGELSNNMGKAVLSQLRETFGAAFTENEGKRLERIEANFTKSPATNKRLLRQALRIAERTAERAKNAAKRRGDMETVEDIDDLLTFTLTEPEQQTQQTQEQIPQPQNINEIPTDQLLRQFLETP